MVSACFHMIIPISLQLQVFVRNVPEQDGIFPVYHTNRRVTICPTNDRSKVTSSGLSQGYFKAAHFCGVS
jgi:hypothetical protein